VRTFRNILAVVLVLGLVAGGGAWMLRGKIATTIYRKGAEEALSANPFAKLPDGLHVALCGSGSPLPDPHRAGPCVAVIAGQRMYVVDIGDGATRNLTLMGLSPAQADALLLTHYHSDHMGGLGELMLQHWAGGAATEPLPVYGPQGLEEVLNGFQLAYQLDRGYRIAHHGPTVVPPQGFGGTAHTFQVQANGGDVVLVDDGGLKITAFPVNHEPVSPAVGYKFAYKGRTVVISCDTAPSPRVEAEAKGADLLVHEALSERLVALQRQAALAANRETIAKISQDIIGYHTTPEQAADIAQKAGVRYLLLDHLVPGVPLKGLEGPFLGDAPKRFKGTLRLGQDGDFISMPAGSDAITRTNRLARFR